jgi:hypothetical protein
MKVAGQHQQIDLRRVRRGERSANARGRRRPLAEVQIRQVRNAQPTVRLVDAGQTERDVDALEVVRVHRAAGRRRAPGGQRRRGAHEHASSGECQGHARNMTG